MGHGAALTYVKSLPDSNRDIRRPYPSAPLILSSLQQRLLLLLLSAVAMGAAGVPRVAQVVSSQDGMG